MCPRPCAPPPASIPACPLDFAPHVFFARPQDSYEASRSASSPKKRAPLPPARSEFVALIPSVSNIVRATPTFLLCQLVEAPALAHPRSFVCSALLCWESQSSCSSMPSGLMGFGVGSEASFEVMSEASRLAAQGDSLPLDAAVLPPPTEDSTTGTPIPLPTTDEWLPRTPTLSTRPRTSSATSVFTPPSPGRGARTRSADRRAGEPEPTFVAVGATEGPIRRRAMGKLATDRPATTQGSLRPRLAVPPSPTTPRRPQSERGRRPPAHFPTSPRAAPGSARSQTPGSSLEESPLKLAGSPKRCASNISTEALTRPASDCAVGCRPAAATPRSAEQLRVRRMQAEAQLVLLSQAGESKAPAAPAAAGAAAKSGAGARGKGGAKSSRMPTGSFFYSF